MSLLGSWVNKEGRNCYASTLLTVVPVRDSFSLHPEHSKTVRPSFGQSVSRPRRSSFSPHRHSSTIPCEQLRKLSGTSSSDTCCIRHPFPVHPPLGCNCVQSARDWRTSLCHSAVCATAHKPTRNRASVPPRGGEFPRTPFAGNRVSKLSVARLYRRV